MQKLHVDEAVYQYALHWNTKACECTTAVHGSEKSLRLLRKRCPLFMQTPCFAATLKIAWILQIEGHIA